MQRNNNTALLIKNQEKIPHGRLELLLNRELISNKFRNYLEQTDIEILTHKKKKTSIYRCLALANYLPLNNVKVIVGRNCLDDNSLSILIQYDEEGKEKIIDYDINLVIDKDLYYEATNMKEYNTLDKFELYYINKLLKDSNCSKNLIQYLVFSKELLNDINEKNNLLKDKYDQLGINKKNQLILDEYSDCIFLEKSDYNNYEYASLIKEINKITTGNNNFLIDIKRAKKANNFEENNKTNDIKKLNHPELGTIEFKLLSSFIAKDLCISDSFIDKKEDITDLFSTNRYLLSHYNAKRIFTKLNRKYARNASLVAGMIKATNNNFFKQSWIELKQDNKIFVLDYTHNLVMEKDIYYKIFGVKALEKTSRRDYIEILNNLSKTGSNYYNPILINYFGKEISNDIKKNKKILLKK